MHQVTVRAAAAAEQKTLEALQRRASLMNAGDREALPANPEAIELPLRQIEAGGVFVAVVTGSIKGFAAILPRADGNAELDALFVNQTAGDKASHVSSSNIAASRLGPAVHSSFTS